MTAPRTRIAEGATDFERDLLCSWEKEQPSDAARQGALALVGVAAGLGATTTAAAGVKAATTSMAPKAAVVGTAALGKWVLVGAGLVALAVGGATVEYTRSSSKETAMVPAVAPAPAPAPTLAPTPAPTATPAPTPAPTPTPTPAPMLAPAPAPTEVSPVAAQPRLAAAPHSLDPRPAALGLGQQVAALDRARDALSAGNAGGALRQLDEYDRQYPRGALTQEATALRIEALLQQGNRDAAARLADRFLAANPRSPYAARIRSLVERPHNP